MSERNDHGHADRTPRTRGDAWSPSRRGLIAGAAAGALGGLLTPRAAGFPGLLRSTLGLPRGPLRPGYATERVVLVVMAGGVRTRETYGSPDQVPNLVQMAREGVAFPRMRTANLGHFGASMSIVTGISEARGIRDNERAPDPTLFEYVRKDLGLAASDVWVTTSGGAQQVNYAYGTHPDYGMRYGATTLDGDGIFNEEFKGVVKRFGVPPRADGDREERIDDLRRILRGGREPDAIEQNRARVEEYILGELGRDVTELRGAGSSDAKALRLARNLLSVFQPRLIGVVLQDADIAHGSFNGYQEVVRRNDAAIGGLMEAIRGDEQLRDTTAVFVLPEFGRDRDLNARRGLDHGDGSDDLRYVQGVAWGPDFRKGETVTSDVRTIDVTPTIARMFGAEARFSRGDVLPRLFA